MAGISDNQSSPVTVYGDRKKLTSPKSEAYTQTNVGKDVLDAALSKRVAQGNPLGSFKNNKQYKTESAGTPPVTKKQFKDLKPPSDTTTGNGALSKTTGANVLDAATNMISGLIPDKGKNTAFQEQQQIGNALMKINPMVGGIYKAASIVGELTGTNVSKMSAEQAKAAGINSATKTLNNLAAYIPGVGILGSTIDAEKSHVIDSMAGAYGGSVSNINTATTMGGQNYLFGRGKAQQFIEDMNYKNKLLTDINQTNTLRKQSDYGMDIAQQNLNRYAGTNYMNVHLGRNGLKFLELDEVRVMLANRQQKQNIEKFANGGVIDGENILPQGQLHARLHHMEESDPELAAKLTRKGIPVVALTEGGEIEQVAEIEHSEWIWSKSLTDKIEDLRKDGSDEAMIDAGKILVEEILFNTKDEGGVINE